MSARNLTGYLLLLFAAVSALVLVVREGGDRGGTPHSTSHPTAMTQPNAGRLIVYYFHSNRRCLECEQMEILSREAVEGGFAKEISSGRLDFLVENWEAPENQSMRKAFGVAFPSVVVVRMRADQVAGYKLLEDARPLLNDKEKFIRYVRAEVSASLGRP